MLETLLKEVQKRYQVYFEPLKIEDKELQFLQIANMSEHIERIVEAGGNLSSLYWAKIWESSIALACLIAKHPASNSKSCLEIRAGIGVVGLFAASVGYKTTITDINEDALLFAKINALKNGLEVEVKKCDFTKDSLPEQYDLIVGSEVCYQKDDIVPLIKFLKNHLKPNGKAYIALNPKMFIKEFYKEAQRQFRVFTNVLKIKGEKESPVFVFKLES